VTKVFIHCYGLRYQYRHQPGFDIFAFADLARAHGFDGLNVSCYGPEYIELSGGDIDHLRKVRAYLERIGMLIDIETHGTDPDYLNSVIGIAQEVGARNLRTFTIGETSPRHRIEEAKRNLTELAKRAGQAGITILLENHEDLSGAEVAEVLSSVNSPWVQGLYDYVNSMLFYEDPFESLEVMRPWIRHAHLKDCIFLPPTPEWENGLLLGVPLGDGCIPVAEITRRLVDIGVERICFENTLGYQAKIEDKRGSMEAGRGYLTWHHQPLVTPREFLDIDELAARDPHELVRREAWALQRSMTWMSSEILPMLK
jgi:sugar phosphate isomerase/epimerase